MSFSTHLTSVIYALVFGILGLISWKVFQIFSKYFTLRKQLSTVPGLPRHWLLGNVQEGQIKDPKSYLATVVREANAGNKVSCFWAGPIPVLTVQHPSSFKELFKQTKEKCKGPTDSYNYLDSWLGNYIYFRRVYAVCWLYPTVSRPYNMPKIKDPKGYLDIVVREANAGHRLFCFWLGPIPVITVHHAETFKELLKQTREKCKGVTDAYNYFDSWLGDGLLLSEGRKWERNRKLLTPAFHFDILNGYIHTMNEGTDVLLDKLAKDTSNGTFVDIFPYICQTTLDAMLKCSLSYEGNIQNDASTVEKGYIQAVKRISDISWIRVLELHLLIKPIFDMHPIGKEFYRLCDQVHAFTGNIIQSRIKELEERKETQAEVTGGKKRRLDFLDILLTAKDEEGRGLSPKEIQDEVDTFTFEGHDTTASAISWAIYALGKHPGLQQKVYEDVSNVLGDGNTVTKEHLGKFSYLPLFIKETLRYFSPVPIIGRANYTSSIVLDGKVIPPNVTIYAQIYAIHHNEEIWPDHMKFDPERFSVNQRDETDVYGFIPFSAGSRNCIGQVFALNEIKINIAKLVKRFEVSIDPTKEAILLPDIVMRAEKGIHVGLKERKERK